MQAGATFKETADTIVTGGIRLPAIITMSTTQYNAPIVVMVHGSGALDHDETVYGNKPFRDKTNIAFHCYPRLNHPFMEDDGKSTPMEYQRKEHVDAYVINDISSFIHHYDTIRKDSCQHQHRLSFVFKEQRPAWSISPDAGNYRLAPVFRTILP